MRLGLLAAAWLAGVFIGLRVDAAAALPVLLLFLATLAAGTVLRLYRRSVWPAVLAGLLHPGLGLFFGWITWVPLSYLVELVSHVPGYTISGAWVGSGLVWAWYIVLGGLLFLASATPYLVRGRPRLGRLLGNASAGSTAPARAIGPALGFTTLGIVLAAAAVFVWMQVLNGPDGKLHVYFFDVGQGDSALIVTPAGRQVLVDGGPEVTGAWICWC